MIGKLYGMIDDIASDNIILNVNNVGYIVHLTSSMLQSLQVGSSVSIFIETYVREDQIKLYGFATKEEISMLKMLVKVKGVSYKIATSMIGEIPLEQIIQGVVGKNSKLLKATGVGMKLASRIITELEGVIARDGITTQDSFVNDAISALMNLGYSNVIAHQMITKAQNKNPGLSGVNELVKYALQNNEEK